MMEKSIALLGMITLAFGLSAMDNKPTSNNRHDENQDNIKYHYDVPDGYTKIVIAKSVLNSSSAEFSDYPFDYFFSLIFGIESKKLVAGYIYRYNIRKGEAELPTFYNDDKYCKLSQKFYWTGKDDSLPTQTDSFENLPDKFSVPKNANLDSSNLNLYGITKKEHLVKLPKLQDLIALKEKFFELYSSKCHKDETKEARKERIDDILNSLRD